MPKTPSYKLFKLVKSLSGPEKRYFKLNANDKWGGEKNKYLTLFDAIDAQEEFDEDALKLKVYEGQAIESRKYSELKAYLYDLILKSLQGYDEKSSIEYKIKSLLKSVKVLYKRSHYEACEELMVKAKKLSIEYESFVHLLEILNWEKQVAFTKEDIAFLDKELDRIDEEEKKCLNQLRNLSIYKNIFYQMIVSIRKDAVLRSEEKVERLMKMMKHPLLRDVSEAQSHLAKVLYHRVYGLYYYSISDYKNFYESSNLFLKKIESKPHILKEDVSDYISAVSNLILSCGLINRYTEVRRNLSKMLKIKPITKHDELRIQRQYYAFKFNLCNFTGEFEEGIEALEDHIKARKKYGEETFQTGSFYLQYFNIYFGAEDFEKALENLNAWLNLPKSIERQDLQSLVRILNLVIHYEMGNTFLLEYLLRSTYRFLRKRNRMFEFEKRVLGFIKNSNKIYTNKELKKAFIILKKDFESLSQIPSEKAMLQYFDFIAWLESKIEGKSFSTVIKEKNKTSA